MESGREIRLIFKSHKLVLEPAKPDDLMGLDSPEFVKQGDKFFKVAHQPKSPITGAPVNRVTYAEISVDGQIYEGIAVCNPEASDQDDSFLGQAVSFLKAYNKVYLAGVDKKAKREIWAQWLCHRYNIIDKMREHRDLLSSYMVNK